MRKRVLYSWFRCLTPIRVLALGLGICLLGCGPGRDSSSGGDQSIATAKVIVPGIPSTDRISAEQYDNTDWKKFEFDQVRGRVQVDIYWDEPDLEAVVNLRDQFGAVVFAWRHVKGRQHESYSDIRVREGVYYLEIKCASGETVYTLEVTDLSTGKGGRGGFDVPPPE
tara:strand:+ start:339 stop:842 length:504 start_codon:yes stop_codon:yes gene_type:complete